ncbi:MAG TPA: DUF559 domain-containing protein [Mycobacteriales bacterium]|nr:DUF559 domain-containing protein [Mycobacteriales bacterium]
MPSPAQIRALNRWLREHHAVVSAERLRALGFSRDYARTQLDARRWQRVHHGVYCAYTGPLSFETRCAAALAACGDAAVVAAATAMVIFGMTGFEDKLINVLIPHGVAAPRLVGVRVTRSATLTARSHLMRRNLPVIRIERAVVGFALMRPGRARAALTAAVQRGLTTPTRLRAAIFAMGRVNGRRRLVEITCDIEGGDRSALERLFLRLLRRAGLPAPAQNYPLRLDGRQLWIDVCYPALRIAIEIDGKAYHLLSEDWEDDLDRQNLVVLDGWLVLRFTGRAIRRHPDRVAAQVAEAIRTRTSLLVALAG